MDLVNAMKVFIAVVEGDGFTAAAKRLNIPLSTVSRKISELEKHLSSQLLIRSTRKISITESGKRFFERACSIVQEISEAELEVSGELTQPKGLLSISAPSVFGRIHILPIVNQFLIKYPEIDAKARLTNRVVDFLEEGINVGVRIGKLPDSSLIAIPLGTQQIVTCASYDYLKTHPKIKSPEDIKNHQCLNYCRAGSTQKWWFKYPENKTARIEVKSRLEVDSIQGVIDSALQLGGLIQLNDYQVAPYLESGRLRTVLDNYKEDRIPVNLIYPKEKFPALKTRTFIEFVTPIIRKLLQNIEETLSRKPT